jgi:hypothetical protein
VTHPITPPPELRQLWAQQAQRIDPLDPVQWMQYVSEKAAQWGADQELEACCEWLKGTSELGLDLELIRTRRPKPPSLKLQALDELVAAERLYPADWSIIRRALEALPDD